jgi:ankyrin repeat protein
MAWKSYNSACSGSRFIAAGDLAVADSLAAFVAALPKPAPTLVDTAFIVALMGYHDEGVLCMQLCRDIYTDSRLLEPLVRQGYGKKQRALLLAAAEGGNAVRVSELLDYGAPVEAKDIFEWTALHWACMEGQTDAARELLDRGADVNARTVARESPLLLASARGHLSVARLLLDRGAETDARATKNVTALILVCQNGHKEVASLLLDRGAEIDARDADNDTALCAACQQGHTEVASLLLIGAQTQTQRVETRCDRFTWRAGRATNRSFA